MTNFLLNIDAGMIDWARAQFALTAIYHWLFVPLTLGLAVIMGIMLLSHEETLLERCCKILAETVRYQFCHGCCYGNHSRVRVRNKLEQLFLVRW